MKLEKNKKKNRNRTVKGTEKRIQKIERNEQKIDDE